jgi:hypothetical protein
MAHSKVARRRESDSARERAAQLRAVQAQRERRRRTLVVVGAVVAVLAIVAVMVVIGSRSKGGSSTSNTADRTPASAAVLTGVTGVSSATLDAIGAGTTTSVPQKVQDAALTVDGKPRLLYVGAEYCPYCAAGRWALVQALSRFGTWSGLGVTTSSSTDIHPDTATFTFHGASYTSDTLSFTGRELQTRTGGPLDKLTDADSALWLHYTGRGSYPFLDIGGRYVEIGQTVDPAVLKGLSTTEIASRLNDPTDPVAKAVDGAANVLTAAICSVTSNAPSNVCTATGVTAAAKALGA